MQGFDHSWSRIATSCDDRDHWRRSRTGTARTSGSTTTTSKFGAWFFGREADGSKIITNLRAARLTLLHAESGVGKSSLLRAGVAWRLHRLADDMFARGRPVRSIPVVFSSWKDDPDDGTGYGGRRGGPAVPGERPDAGAGERPAGRGRRGRVGRGERQPAHHARPVRGVLPLPLPRAGARAVRRRAGPLRQPDRPARQLPDRDPRGRLRRPRRPVQGAHHQRLRQLPAHRLPRSRVRRRRRSGNRSTSTTASPACPSRSRSRTSWSRRCWTRSGRSTATGRDSRPDGRNGGGTASPRRCCNW